MLQVSRYLFVTRRVSRTQPSWELSLMDGGLLGGIPLDGATLIRLGAVLVLAIAVRQLVLRFGNKAIDRRRDKGRSDKPRR